MEGWSIFKHSVLLVLRNWKEALKIALVPMLALVVLAVALFSTIGGTPAQAGEDIFNGGMAMRGLLMMAVSAFLIIGIAVNWHRFVILEAYPEGWLPPFPFGIILGYLGRSLLIVLLLMVIIIPVVLLLGGVTLGNAAMLGLITTMASLAGSYLFFRVAAILPAGAIEQSMTLKDAWQATARGKNAILGLVFIIVAVNLAVQAIGYLPVLGGLLSGILGLFFAMVNVSILTTIFGHYVQGRPID